MRKRLNVLSMRHAGRLAFALCVLGQAAWGLPAMAAEKVVMGWLPATDALPFFVALEEKAFEKVGIEVVNQKFTSPTTLVDAYLSNQVEVGPYGTAPGIALAAEAQNPGSLKLFGFSGGVADTDYVNSSLLVKPDSPIKAISDLRGKKIGHMPGIQWRTNTKYILRNAGIDPDKDVVLTELALNVQLPAVISGTVDALITIEPMGSMGIASGDVRAVVSNVGAKYITNPWFGGGAVMTTKFIKERPEVARKVMLVLREITDKIQANFDQYRPLLAKYVGVPEASLPVVKKLIFRNERDVDEKDLRSEQNVIDMLYKEKVIPVHFDIREKFVRLDDIK
jgi:NitT/TauT family transport system substrate-binding protein